MNVILNNVKNLFLGRSEQRAQLERSYSCHPHECGDPTSASSSRMRGSKILMDFHLRGNDIFKRSGFTTKRVRQVAAYEQLANERGAHPRRGFTFLEMMISMSIILIMAAVAAYYYKAYHAKGATQGAAQILMQDIKLAAEEAAGTQRTTGITFTDATDYTVWESTPCSACGYCDPYGALTNGGVSCTGAYGAASACIAPASCTPSFPYSSFGNSPTYVASLKTVNLKTLFPVTIYAYSPTGTYTSSSTIYNSACTSYGQNCTLVLFPESTTNGSTWAEVTAYAENTKTLPVYFELQDTNNNNPSVAHYVLVNADGTMSVK